MSEYKPGYYVARYKKHFDGELVIAKRLDENQRLDYIWMVAGAGSKWLQPDEILAGPLDLQDIVNAFRGEAPDMPPVKPPKSYNTLPPFGSVGQCVKCETIAMLRPFYLEYKPERVLRICWKCGYQWDEACADAERLSI